MPEAKKSKKAISKSKKISDVSKKSAANPASRAIIVNNRPILKDPMMAEDTSQADTSVAETDTDDAEVKVEVRRSSKKITPEVESSNEQVKPSESEIADDSENSASSVDKNDDLEAEQLNQALRNLTQPESVKKAEQMSNEEDDKTKKDGTNDGVQVEKPEETEADEVAESSSAPEKAIETETKPTEEKPAPDKADQELVADDQLAQKDSNSSEDEVLNPEDSSNSPKPNVEQEQHLLSPEQLEAIESGKYFLPIKTVSNKRLRRDLIVFAILSVILVIVWLDILLDAGLIELGNLKALTDFL